MQDRIAELESRLAGVEKRLAALERLTAEESAYDSADREPSLGEGFAANASTHLGRVLLIFGGAYLLRAITDFDFVPTAIGLTMGAAYALYWLLMAWRNAAVETRRATAAFYAATSVLLALPLLVEATTTFAMLSGRQALAAAGTYFVLAMIVAVSRKLTTLAWLVTAGVTLTAIALLIVSHEAVLVVLLLLGVGLVSLWTVYTRDWMALQWLGAIAANVAAVTLIVFSQNEQWSLDAGTALAVCTLLLISYFASFALRSHVQGGTISVFEFVQAVAVAGIAFWAARNAAEGSGQGLAAIGALSLFLGVCAYALALSPATRRPRGPNFYFYSTLGLLLIIAGTPLLLEPLAAAVAWSLLALLLAATSGRTGWVSLSLQSTVLLVAAGIASGLLAAGLQALGGEASNTWPAVNAWILGIAGTTVACLFLPVAQYSARWGTAAGIPQLVVLALSVWEVGGLMVAVAAPAVAGAGGAEPNLAVLAALRTAVLAAASVTLALSSRFRRWPEARWLVYPVLVVVGIKLFIEDFPNGQPGTLFVALAFVGSALLIVAKLLGSRESLASADS